MPPGRSSKLMVVVVKPFGPHHCARCLGSVQASKTRSRGASNSRMPMIARGSLSRSRLLFAPMLLLLLAMFARGCFAGFLGLQRFQIAIEAIEALVVEAAIMVEPVVDRLECARLDAARPPLRCARARDQAGTFQHFQMLGDGGQAHGERFRQILHGGFALGEPRQDGAAGWIGEGAEGGIEVHLALELNN